MWMSLSATPDRDVVYADWEQSKARREVVVRAVKRNSAEQPVHLQPNEDYFADSDFEPDSAGSDEDHYYYEVVEKSGFLVEDTGVRMTRLFRHTIFAYINNNLKNIIILIIL